MSFIYKYLPPERKSYLTDALLRFTPPSALNDPYECLPALPEELNKAALDYLKSMMSVPPKHKPGTSRIERRIADRNYEKNAKKVLRKYTGNPEKLRDYFYAQALKNMNANIGILSLSKRWDSALMWSHYTDSHKGLCIGFNREHKFFKRNNTENESGNFLLRPVIYSDKRSIVPNNRPNTTEAMEIIFTKSVDWEYEQEERAIASLANATETINSDPFKLSLFHVPHDSIEEIVIGVRSSDAIFQSTSNLAKKLSIPLYKANISNLSFNLERERVDT